MRGAPRAAQARLGISVVVGVVVLLAVGLLSSLPLGVLSGIAGMGAVFVLTGLAVLWPPGSSRADDTSVSACRRAGRRGRLPR